MQEDYEKTLVKKLANCDREHDWGSLLAEFCMGVPRGTLKEAGKKNLTACLALLSRFNDWTSGELVPLLSTLERLFCHRQCYEEFSSCPGLVSDLLRGVRSDNEAFRHCVCRGGSQFVCAADRGCGGCAVCLSCRLASWPPS